MNVALREAYRAYHAVPPGVSWEDAVQAHWERGLVINCPELFLLGRLVRSDWSEARLLDVNSVAMPEEADMWFIWCAGGDLRFVKPWADGIPMRFVAYQHRSYAIIKISWEKALQLFQPRNQYRHPSR